MRIRSLLLIATLLLSTAAFGKSCRLTDLCGWWEGYGGLLVWRPCEPNFQYGEKGTPLMVKPEYEVGFKFGGSYMTYDQCSRLSLDIYYYKASSVSSAVGPGLSVFHLEDGTGLTSVESAKAALKTQYIHGSLRGQRRLFCLGGSRVYAYGGLGYLEIIEDRRLRTTNPSENPQRPGTNVTKTQHRGAFEGGQGEAGIGGEFDIGCGFRIWGEMGVSAALGAGRHQVQTKTFFPKTSDKDPQLCDNFIIPSQNKTHCVPGTDLKVAIAYQRCLCYAEVTAEIGYQAVYYMGLFELPEPYVDRVDGITHNVGFAGPYAQINVRF